MASVFRFTLSVFNIPLQGVDHFHNGPVNAHLLAAVVDVIVAVHHAVGDGVQLAGVLAKLAQGVTDDEGHQHNADKQHHNEHADDHAPGVIEDLVAGGAGLFAAFHVEIHNGPEALGGFMVQLFGGGEHVYGSFGLPVPGEFLNLYIHLHVLFPFSLEFFPEFPLRVSVEQGGVFRLGILDCRKQFIHLFFISGHHLLFRGINVPDFRDAEV